jgi:hypothetical protein
MGVSLYQATQQHVPEGFSLHLFIWLMVVTEIIFQQVDKITKQMQLEAQLADAKLAKAKMEMAAEKEVLLKEKQQLLMVIDMSDALLEVQKVLSNWLVSSASMCVVFIIVPSDQ